MRDFTKFTCFEGGLEADFIVVLGVPQLKVFLVGEQVGSVENRRLKVENKLFCFGCCSAILYNYISHVKSCVSPPIGVLIVIAQGF